ncbi:MAG: hypothetical protein VXY88_01245 [Bacteroidota bacterium]|nr:hypothetical protein [Bacteroidota bacterium]
MFSSGQLIFVIIFALVFVFVLVMTYRKDANLHKNYYKGVFWILIIFVAFISGIAAIKFFLGY